MMVWRFRYLAVLVLLGMACACPAQSMEYDLLAIRGIYEKELGKIEAEVLTARATVPAGYLAALAALEKKKQQAGDLNGLLAVRQESGRFRTERTIKDEDVVRDPPDLAQLQKKTQEQFANCGKMGPGRIVDLADKYITRLKGMQASLTRAGKIDDALLVNAEINRVKESQKVKAARFAVAEGATSGGDVDPGDVAEPVEPAEPEKKDLPAVVQLEGATIYRGQRPTTPRGIFYKRLAMRPTAAARLKRDVNMQVLQAGAGPRNFVRMALRATGSGVKAKDMRLLVQAFEKPAWATGKIEPRKIHDVTIPVEQVGSDAITVDVGPFSLSPSYSSERKPEFYGVAVGVFDSAGELLYQSVFPSSLEPYVGSLKAVPEQPAAGEGGGDVVALRAAAREAQEAYMEARREYYADRGDEELRREFEDAERAMREAYTRVRQAQGGHARH